MYDNPMNLLNSLTSSVWNAFFFNPSDLWEPCGCVFVSACVYSVKSHTTLAPMLVCPLPSHGMDAETGICGGAKGAVLAWAMLV